MRERPGNGHEMAPPSIEELQTAVAGYIASFADTTKTFPDVAFEASVISRLSNPFASGVPRYLAEFSLLWIDVAQREASQLDLEIKRREALAASLRAYVHSGYDVDGTLVYQSLKPFRHMEINKQWLWSILHPSPEDLSKLGIRNPEQKELWGKPSFRAELQLGFIPFPRLRKVFGRY
jgi:hypothetical protein